MEQKVLYCNFEYLLFGLWRFDSMAFIKLTNFFITNYSIHERSYPSSLMKYMLFWKDWMYNKNRLNNMTSLKSLKTETL